MAVKTVRPKKNGKPQSKVPEFGPPRELKTDALLLLNNVSAFETVKLIVFVTEPELAVAETLAGETGQ